MSQLIVYLINPRMTETLELVFSIALKCRLGWVLLFRSTRVSDGKALPEVSYRVGIRARDSDQCNNDWEREGDRSRASAVVCAKNC